MLSRLPYILFMMMIFFISLDFSTIGYSHYLSLETYTIFFIFVLSLCFIYQLGYSLNFKTIPFHHSEVANIIFIWIPLIVLTFVCLFSLANFQFNLPLDRQPYKDSLGNIMGIGLIHLAPFGAAYCLFNEKSKSTAILLILLSLIYTILYSERLALLPMLIVLLIAASNRSVLSLKKLFFFGIFTLLVFIISEMSRSFIYMRLDSGEFDFFMAVSYSFDRIGVYYLDAINKSSDCFVNGICEYQTWWTAVLTNKGSLYPWVVNFGVLGAVMYSSFAFFTGGLVLRQVTEMIRKNSTPDFLVLLAPLYATGMIEFFRYPYFSASRFLLPLSIFIIYVLIRSKKNW